MDRRYLHAPHHLGDKIADRAVEAIGSWPFIIGQAILLAFWFVFNSLTVTGIVHYDPYPFILCNLFMSAEAAFASPLILKASNRAAEISKRRDDLEAQEVQAIFESHTQILAHLTRCTMEEQEGLTARLVARLDEEEARAAHHTDLLCQLIEMVKGKQEGGSQREEHP